MPAMFAAAARLEAQLAFARVEYAMPCWAGSRPPRSVKRRDHPRKRPLSPMMLVATDVTVKPTIDTPNALLCSLSREALPELLAGAAGVTVAASPQ